MAAGDEVTRAPRTSGTAGPCRLVRRLGAGGMATVYEGRLLVDRDWGERGQRVAVKLLHPHLVSEPEALARFEREALLGQRIRHPGLVRTLEFGRDAGQPDPMYYLVLEYVEGRTLSGLMQTLRTLPEALLRQIARQIAASLDAVHALGAVHRDVKPANVMLTPADQVKLMDLGVARFGDRMTGTGGFVGSPLYAAPEQLGGEVGPATDLYSLGVVLYEAATGVQPFAAEPAEGVLMRQLRLVPEKAGRINGELSPFFEELCACLMEKEPSRRIASAAMLGDILDAGEDSRWWREREDLLRSRGAPQVLRRIAIGRALGTVGRALGTVGRARELAALEAHFDLARSSQGGLVLLEGEAGVGKTRLLHEFLGRLEGRGEPAHLLYGAHLRDRGGRQDAFAEALVAHLGAGRLADRIHGYLADLPLLATGFLAHLTGAPLSSPRALDATTIEAAFCQIAAALAAELPVVWEIDDLHFANADARAVLLALARIAPEHRLLLVAAGRHLPPRERQLILGVAGTTPLPLGRLARAEVVELIAGSGGTERLPELVELIAERTDGNPFFLLETLRVLGERRVAAGGDEATVLSSAARAMAVPSSVQAVLRDRLTGLTADERTLIEVAAVQGLSFEADLVARALGRGRLRVLQELAAIEHAHGVVHARGVEFRFDHQLLRDVLYDDLEDSTRRDLHARLAHAYRDRAGLATTAPPAMPGDAAAFIATHSLRGGDRPDTRLIARALDHLAERGDNAAELDLVELAAQAPGDLGAELHLRRAQCLELCGRRTEALQGVSQAIAAAVVGADVASEARGQLLLATLRRETGDYQGAQGAGARALALAAEIGDRVIEASATRALGMLAIYLGDYNRCQGLFTRSAELAQAAGDRRAEAAAIGSLGILLHKTARYEEACAQYDRQLELCRHLGDRRGEITALGNLSNTLQAMGLVAQAVTAVEQVLTLSRACGYRPGEANARFNLGSFLCRLGEIERGRGELDRSLALAREVGDRRIEANSLGALGRAHFFLGDWAAARDFLASAIEAATEIGYPSSRLAAMTFLTALELAEGDLDAAARHADAALAQLDDAGLQELAMETTLNACAVSRARGERDAAMELAGRALAIGRTHGAEEALALATFNLGRLNLEHGRRDQAIPLLTEAHEHGQRVGTANPGPLPGAYLALVGQVSPATVTVSASSPVHVRIEALAVLHRAGGDGDLAGRAHALLASAARHLTGDRRERFHAMSPLARLLDAEK